MANPTKAKDPAEAALSAVEEALKLDFGGPDTTETTSAAEASPAQAEPARRSQGETRGQSQREEQRQDPVGTRRRSSGDIKVPSRR